MAGGSVKDNPRNKTKAKQPPALSPFRFNPVRSTPVYGSTRPLMGYGAGYGMAPGGYGTGWNDAGAGYGYTPAPYWRPPYQQYGNWGMPPAAAARADVPPAASDRGRWGDGGPTHQGWWEGMQGRNYYDDQVGNPWRYGLTEGQTEEGYVPGASERNSFGQPLGTIRPYGQTRHATHGFARQARPGAEVGDVYRSKPRKDGGDTHWKPEKHKPRVPGKSKKGKGGSGATPAWTGGIASFNV